MDGWSAAWLMTMRLLSHHARAGGFPSMLFADHAFLHESAAI
jgi:hypothetical protein